MASQEGHVNIAKVLIKAGGNVNQAQKPHGIPPLYAACENKHHDIVRLLNQHNDLRLGDYYYYGYGNVPKDTKKAVKYYRLASAAGVAEAAYSLAVMYADGELTASGGSPSILQRKNTTTTKANKDDSSDGDGDGDGNTAQKQLEEIQGWDSASKDWAINTMATLIVLIISLMFLGNVRKYTLQTLKKEIKQGEEAREAKTREEAKPFQYPKMLSMSVWPEAVLTAVSNFFVENVPFMDAVKAGVAVVILLATVKSTFFLFILDLNALIKMTLF